MRVSLTIRIFLSFIVMLMIFGGTTLYGILRMDAIRQDLRLTSEGYLQLTRSLAQVKTIAESRDAYVERSSGETDLRLRQYLVRYARNFYPRVLRARLKNLSESAQSLAKHDLSRRDQKFVDGVSSQLVRIVELNDLSEKAGNAYFDQLEQDDPAQREELNKEQKRRSESLYRELKLLSLNLDSKIASGVIRAQLQERNAVWALIILAVAGSLVGLLITWWLTRALRPLHELTQGARAISRGDFDVEVSATGRQDEIGTLARGFREMATGLKQREQILARRREEFASLNAFLENVLDSVTTGVVVCDREKIITVANRSAKALQDLSLTDPIGKSLQDIPLGAVLRPSESILQQILQGGPELHLDAQGLRLSDTKSLLIDVRVLPFKQAGAPSQVGGWVFLLDDVSEREQSRERLLQSERLAAMGRLAAQVTHEIRNPLSSIGLNCELLSEDLVRLVDKGSESHQLLKAISDEIDRLSELTEGYLQYARLPAARLRPADLPALLRDIADFVRPDFARQELGLSLKIDADLPEFSMDPSRVRLAILNLLRNAAEASPAQSTIDVRAFCQDAKVCISVEDRGAGVAQEDQDKLFNAFFTTREEGTGLGLHVTREVAREHGGDAYYRDRQDGGACFVLALATQTALSS